MSIDRLGNWIDAFAADLGRRGFAPSEIREHVNDVLSSLMRPNRSQGDRSPTVSNQIVEADE